MLSTVLKHNQEGAGSAKDNSAASEGIISVVTDDGVRFQMSIKNADLLAINKILGGKLTALEHGNVLIAPNPDGSFSDLIPGATYAAHYIPDPHLHDPREMAKKLALKQKPMSRKQVMSIFSHFDTDCSGAIDRDEFRAMAACMDLHMDDSEIDNVFTIVDLDKNGTIEFEEFYEWLIYSKRKGNIMKSGLKKLATHAGFVPQDNPDKILEIFNKIDTDKSGAIDPDEFRALVRDMHLKMDDVEVMALFKSIDLDGNGTLEFNEFLTWWQNSVSGYGSMSDAAWQLRLGMSEAQLQEATGLVAKKKGEEDEDKKDKKEEEEDKKAKKPAKKAAAAMKWTNVDKFGDKWRAPGQGKKEKNLQCAQYSKVQNTVSLRGCIVSEGGAEAVAFTLPANCAPKTQLRFNAFLTAGKKSSPAEVVITPDGKVTVSSTDACEFWLSGISFDQ